MRGFLRSATHHACFSRTKRSVGWEVFGTLRRYEVEKDWHCSLKRDRSNEKLSLFFAKLAVCLIPAKNSVIYQNCKTSWYKKIKVGRLPIAKTFFIRIEWDQVWTKRVLLQAWWWWVIVLLYQKRLDISCIYAPQYNSIMVNKFKWVEISIRVSPHNQFFSKIPPTYFLLGFTF